MLFFIGLLFFIALILLMTLGSDTVQTYTVIGFAILMGGGTVWYFINPNKQIIYDNSKKYPNRKSNSTLKYIFSYIVSALIASIMFCIDDVENSLVPSYALRIIFACVIALVIPYSFYKIDKRYPEVVIPESLQPYDEVFNSPVGRESNKYSENVKKYGYTESMLKTADKVIAEHKEGKSVDMLLLKDYVMYPAEYCCIKHEYKKALDYLNIISVDDLMEHKILYLNGGISVYSYLITKMEACRGLGDKFLADDVMQEAKKYVDLEGLSYTKLFLKDVCLYNYYMLIGEFENAKECAERLLTYKTIELDSVTAYVINAEIMKKLNDKEGFNRMMGIAREKAKKTYAPIKQIYNEYLTRFELDEPPLEIY